MDLINMFQQNYYYVYSIILFLIGFHTILTHSNFFKKVIGLNIVDGAIFLLFVGLGYIDGGRPPIADGGQESIVVNPLPSALILTGIVVSTSVTAYALSLIIKLYKHYGTMNADEIVEMRRSSNEN